MFHYKRYARNPFKRGFTLLEMLIAAGIFSTLVIIVNKSVVVGMRSVASGMAQSDLSLKLISATERMDNEIRLTQTITQADQDVLVFDADLNGDDVVETGIEYALTVEGLVRSHQGTSKTLIPEANAFVLNYLDASGSEIATPVADAALNTIRVIRIQTQKTEGEESFSLDTALFVPNMR